MEIFDVELETNEMHNRELEYTNIAKGLKNKLEEYNSNQFYYSMLEM